MTTQANSFQPSASDIAESLAHSTASALSSARQNGSVPALPAWLTDFTPRRGLSNGHVQTIVGDVYPRPPFRLASQTDEVVVDASDNTRVLCHTHWQPGTESDPDSGKRLTVVLVHGLEGSSDSRYIQGLTARAWNAGCNVVRMNMRNCGGTDELTPTLYHSGLSGDVGAVVEHYTRQRALEQVALVGYSMGGNLVLKLAGELGLGAPGEKHSEIHSKIRIRAVAAVCPAIDLAASSDALHTPRNRLYEWHFLRRLIRRYRHKAALYPQIYSAAIAGSIRSLREFDDEIVARYCGFRDSEDYYYRAAAARVLGSIAVPTLLLRSLDDPFIRVTEETRETILANPHIALVETTHGGHCAFLSPGRGDAIHWAEAAVVRFLLEATGQSSEG